MYNQKYLGPQLECIPRNRHAQLGYSEAIMPLLMKVLDNMLKWAHNKFLRYSGGLPSFVDLEEGIWHAG